MGIWSSVDFTGLQAFLLLSRQQTLVCFLIFTSFFLFLLLFPTSPSILLKCLELTLRHGLDMLFSWKMALTEMLRMDSEIIKMLENQHGVALNNPVLD